MVMEGCCRQVQPVAGHLDDDLGNCLFAAEKQGEADHSFAAYGCHLDDVACVAQRNHRSNAEHRKNDLLDMPPSGLQNLPRFEGLQAQIGNDSIEARLRQGCQEAVRFYNSQARRLHGDVSGIRRAFATTLRRVWRKSTVAP